MMRKNILLFINFVENCICDERIYIYDLKKKKNGVSVSMRVTQYLYCCQRMTCP